MKLKFLMASLSLFAASTAAQADTRLLVNCFFGSGHQVCTNVVPAWIEEVERVTEGRVTARILPKSVAPPPEQLNAVEKGLVDVAVQFNGLIQNRIQGPAVAMQPFVGTYDAEKMSVALWDTNRAYFPDEFETVHLLSQFVISPGRLYSQTNTPINSIEELAARKIWVLPGPLAEIAKRLKAGVVSTPAVQSNEIISRGVVDGFLGVDADALRSFQLMPYAQSNTKFEVPIYTTSFSMFISKDTWAELSPEDQDAIMEVSGAALAAKFGAAWDESSAAAEAMYEEEEIEVIEADPAFEAELIEASAFITEKWLKDAAAAGIDAQGALDFYKGQLSK
ncbi:TRAP transporter substrate-binding protein DctP [Alphaproteobacteria bacterium KMM 3653]|uniref:TRAP transporter substrate-binding protein DctP n=1 Tax=Harenicola maris TaxID=2841044 RepID=A0AAP2CLS3_9RHOB|nr:TRAP transporter substrate-binding protein DctP [Harenicola maris]